MKFAVALLIGAVSATKVEEFSTIAPHSYIEKPFNPNYIQQESESESSDSDDEALQTTADARFDTFPVAYDGTHFYERVITPMFSQDTDDIFMRSMIKKYAVEERTDHETLDDGQKVGGEPTGLFWMTKATTAAAAKEVLNTHKGLSGEMLDSYMDTYFDKAWAHFDVNKSGEIEVLKMPQFMRFICSDQRMSLGESG